jgi:hypothetical protein
MYYRKGRFSFYLSKSIIWVRIRDNQMMPKGLFFRMGAETVNG